MPSESAPFNADSEPSSGSGEGLHLPVHSLPVKAGPGGSTSVSCHHFFPHNLGFRGMSFFPGPRLTNHELKPLNGSLTNLFPMNLTGFLAIFSLHIFGFGWS